MATDSRRTLIVKLMVTTAVQTSVLAALLLGAAGTLAWWRAWVFVAIVAAGTLAASFAILGVNQALLAERMKPPIQRGQPLTDKILLPAILAAFAGLLVFSARDAFALHVFARPNGIVSSLGLGLFIVGWTVAYLGMRENAFAAPVVKHQADRAQLVVDTGLYHVVRHPMYAGGVLVFIGTPLWLESFAATLLASIPIALVALRILAEENLLRRLLPGYAAYASRVRYRLIPYFW